MRENNKIYKTDKRNKLIKNKTITNVIYLLHKYLKVKVHKIWGCQRNAYIPTFV